MPFAYPSAPVRAALLLPSALVVDRIDAIPATFMDVMGGYCVLALAVNVGGHAWRNLHGERMTASAGWGLSRDAEGLHVWAGRWHALWAGWQPWSGWRPLAGRAWLDEGVRTVLVASLSITAVLAAAAVSVVAGAGGFRVP